MLNELKTSLTLRSLAALALGTGVMAGAVSANGAVSSSAQAASGVPAVHCAVSSNELRAAVACF